VKVTDNNVTVKVSGDLRQAVPSSIANNTADPFGTLPIFAVHVLEQNSSRLSSSLQIALSQKNPKAYPSQVLLDATSNGTQYHYNLSFNVQGISAIRGDVETIDLSWRSFVFEQDFKLGNVSINSVLSAYLGSSIAYYAQLPTLTGPPNNIRRTWYLNNLQILNNAVPLSTQNLELLNFTSLNKPLQNWTISPKITSQSTVYTLDAGFNLTNIERINEPEGATNFARNAIYTMSATFEVPWNAVASNDTVIIEQPGSWSSWVMIGLVAGTVAVLVLSIVGERLVQSRQTVTAGRRQKK
jgi:hypothetical protein